ncbi:hypothetical protein NE237_002526 [Protea cynaroides]|uniref:Uncharacterized protein n=1 Tax=Protea cynaroides TaxID=273540 RepID=A0A9Q0KVC9_9MAGN|nr:hypothetical protein NE237_002526 [Protea cynaroides]
MKIIIVIDVTPFRPISSTLSCLGFTFLGPEPTLYVSMGSISESDLPCEIWSSLRRQAKGHAQLGQIPQRLSKVLSCHTNAVNSIQWSPTYSHLLASVGMDHAVCVWNVWCRSQQKARVFKYHNAVVKDVRWSRQGLSLLSSGYDCSSRLVNVGKGIETQFFKEDQSVGVIKFHLDKDSLFISRGSKGLLRLGLCELAK